MNESVTDELVAKIRERHSTLLHLLESTKLQEAAIEAGRMSELMQILGNKQRLVNEFVAASEQLRALSQQQAITDLPEESRLLNEQCNELHRNLLEREAACEASLSASREKIEEELSQVDAAKRAASGYSQQNRGNNTSGGGGLDLSL